MSDKPQKNQLVLAGTEEDRSEAPKTSQEGTESRTARCETERAAGHERLNRRHDSRGALGLPEAALALDTGTAVERDLQTTTGATGGNSEAGRRSAKAWQPDGAGSFDPAGGDAATATQMGPDFLRIQSRLWQGASWRPLPLCRLQRFFIGTIIGQAWWR